MVEPVTVAEMVAAYVREHAEELNAPSWADMRLAISKDRNGAVYIRMEPRTWPKKMGVVEAV